MLLWYQRSFSKAAVSYHKTNRTNADFMEIDMRTKSVFQRLFLIVLFALASFMIVEPVSAQDTNWSTIVSIDDCSGSSEQTNTPEDLPCQSYSADLYESLEYSNTAPECCDIQRLNFGSDADFVYVQWDLLGAWNTDCDGHHAVVEFDVDSTVETNGQGDVFIAMNMKDECDTGGSWEDGANPGFDAFEDDNDDVGGANPGSPDFPSGADGYSNDIGSGDSNEVFCRIEGGNFEIAIRRAFIPGLAAHPDDDLRIRAWTSQVSTLDKSKLDWHDQQPTSDISGTDFDNTLWGSTVPTALSLVDFGATAERRGMSKLMLLFSLVIGSLLVMTRASGVPRRL